MVETVPLPCCLPWLPTYFPLWRLCLLPEINTITSWFGRNMLKEETPFIQVLAVFYWYTGQSVLNKTELNLQFQRNRPNSLSWYRFVRHTCPTSPKASETVLHSARGKMGSAIGKKKDWEVASALFARLRSWLGSWQSTYIPNTARAGRQPWGFGGLSLQAA